MKLLIVAVAIALLSVAVVEIYGGSGDYHDCKLDPDSGYECENGTTPDPNILWYYANLQTGYCEEIWPPYMGCGGNSNRFPDITSCEGHCAHQGDRRPNDTTTVAPPSSPSSSSLTTGV